MTTFTKVLMIVLVIICLSRHLAQMTAMNTQKNQAKAARRRARKNQDMRQVKHLDKVINDLARKIQDKTPDLNQATEQFQNLFPFFVSAKMFECILDTHQALAPFNLLDPDLPASSLALFIWAIHMVDAVHPLKMRAFACLAHFVIADLCSADVIVECNQLLKEFGGMNELERLPDHAILAELFCKMHRHGMGGHVQSIVQTLRDGRPTENTGECILSVFRSVPLSQITRPFLDFFVAYQRTLASWAPE